MKIFPNGYFSHTIKSDELSKGLRPSSRLPRNNTFLTKCQGAIGQDGVLRAIDSLSVAWVLTDPLVVKNDFPFPQLFILDKHIIICNRTSILEVVNNVITLKINTTTGNTWSCESSFDHIYLSNGVVSVVRNAGSGNYALSTTLPKTSSICNFNGQVFVGNVKG